MEGGDRLDRRRGDRLERRGDRDRDRFRSERSRGLLERRSRLVDEGLEALTSGDRREDLLKEDEEAAAAVLPRSGVDAL